MSVQTHDAVVAVVAVGGSVTDVRWLLSYDLVDSNH